MILSGRISPNGGGAKLNWTHIDSVTTPSSNDPNTDVSVCVADSFASINVTIPLPETWSCLVIKYSDTDNSTLIIVTPTNNGYYSSGATNGGHFYANTASVSNGVIIIPIKIDISYDKTKMYYCFVTING